MKIQFEPADIDTIAQKVADHLKPLLHDADQEKDDELLTVDQVATLLQVKKAQVYQWVNKSKDCLEGFPFLKTGRLLRFSKRAIIGWLEANSKRLEKR